MLQRIDLKTSMQKAIRAHDPDYAPDVQLSLFRQDKNTPRMNSLRVKQRCVERYCDKIVLFLTCHGMIQAMRDREVS